MANRGATRPNGPNTGNKICQFKLVLLGESAVGKSSLVLRFVKGQFHEFQESTIGGEIFFLHCFIYSNHTLTKNTFVFQLGGCGYLNRSYSQEKIFKSTLLFVKITSVNILIFLFACC